jgi:LysR family glycine cleavage system transcriptional activator
MLLEADPPLRTPRDLAHVPLIHVTGYPHYAEDWPLWLKQAGLDPMPKRRGFEFDQSAMALQAAIQGTGVALGRSPLVEGELESGRLVAPFEFRLTGRGAYWIVCPTASRDRRHVAAFRSWLLAQAGSG